MKHVTGIFGKPPSHQKTAVCGVVGLMGGSSNGSGGGVSLLSAWPMNEGSGNTFFDSTSGGNNQTISASSGSWGTVAGFPGSVFTFNGTGGSTGATSALTAFTGATPFSVTLWLIPTSGGAFTPLLSTIQGSAPFIGWDLGEVNGSLQLRIINTYSTNTLAVATAAASLPIGSLTYLAVTYDGSKNGAGVKMYFNAVSQTTHATFNSLASSAASANPVEMGMDRAGDIKFTSTMAFVEIFSGVLSSAQISSAHAAGPGIH